MLTHMLAHTLTHTHTPGPLPTAVLNEHHQVPPHCKKEIYCKYCYNLLGYTEVYCTCLQQWSWGWGGRRALEVSITTVGLHHHPAVCTCIGRGGEESEREDEQQMFLSQATHHRTLGQKRAILTFVRILSVIFVSVSWSNLAPVLQVGTIHTSPAAHMS